MTKLFITLLSLSLGVTSAFAQDGAVVNADDFLKGSQKAAPVKPVEVVKELPKSLSPLEVSVIEAKKELENEDILAQKVALARKMHQMRPTRDQVDAAVNRVAQSLPEQSRQNFINTMRSMLNYNAIERISIDAMIETYTQKELTSMVEYYSKPEAVTASMKVGLWASKIQPEVNRMIDKALMRIRTGQ